MEAEVVDALGAHFEAARVRCRAPRIAWGVIADGSIAASHDAVRPFRIASLTKGFTAAAVLILRDRGALTLDAPLGDVVPAIAGIPLPTADSPALTARHLLTMSGGLASDNPWADRQLDATPEWLDAVLRRGLTFADPPGTAYHYSNTGFVLLGLAVAAVSGRTLQEFVSEELLDPLGMTHTTWTQTPGAPMPYRVEDGVAVHDAPPLGDGVFAPLGGLWSSVDDMLRWAAFLLGAFPARDGADPAPLRRASRREMQQLWRHAAGRPLPLDGAERVAHGGYGMGLAVHTDELLGRIVHHSGGLPGYGAHIALLPERSFGIVALANVTYAPMFEANLRALEMLRVRGALPPPAPVAAAELASHAAALLEVLTSWDGGAARRVLAGNVALDESLERRRRAAAALLGRHGPLHVGDVVALNAAEADATLCDDRGRPVLRLEFALSPEVPPRVQEYTLVDLG